MDRCGKKLCQFQNSLSYNCGEIERESEGLIRYDCTIEVAANSQNLLADGSRGKQQQLPELILAKK